ncbi:MAG: hypothetical protein CMK00_04945 [Planctomycetes bacterium]|jgi:hypothetical protein|nr:hypothetical protein [Planctomycetota bacterium]
MSLLRVIVFVAGVTALVAPLRAGEKYRELGLTVDVPRNYEEVPTQPNEEWVVIYYAEKLPRKAADRRRVRPSLSLVWIDWMDDPVQPPAEAEPVPGEEGEEAVEEAAAPPPPINSIERYLEQRQRGFELGRSKGGRERFGFETTEFLLIPAVGNRTPQEGWVHAWKRADRTLALIGFCHADDREECVKTWQRVASKLRIEEPEGSDDRALRRFYESSRGRKYRDPEFRIRAKKSLARGWKAEDTPNFVVVSHTNDEPLVRKICRDIELMREEYIKRFPPAGEIKAVSVVRVCANREEYLTYGGMPGSAGYWNSATEELVLYDARKVGKAGPSDDSNTFIVLYHEAFHQYIHYSTGELPPHSWYNEGTGDYFSGAVVKNGKVRRIGVNPWRLGTIQRAIREGKHVPWETIIRWEQRDYYRNGGQNYAQGWSMIYFLRTAPAVEDNERWAAILPTYFDTLKAEYGRELAELADDASHAVRSEAGKRARERAVEAAFLDVDLKRLELTWAAYTKELELP